MCFAALREFLCCLTIFMVPARLQPSDYDASVAQICVMKGTFEVGLGGSDDDTLPMR